MSGGRSTTPSTSPSSPRSRRSAPRRPGIPSSRPACSTTPKVPTLGYSLSAAKAELAKSAYPHGFSTSILVPSGNTQYVDAATIIQQAAPAAQDRRLDPAEGRRRLHGGVRGLQLRGDDQRRHERHQRSRRDGLLPGATSRTAARTRSGPTTTTRRRSPSSVRPRPSSTTPSAPPCTPRSRRSSPRTRPTSPSTTRRTSTPGSRD